MRSAVDGLRGALGKAVQYRGNNTGSSVPNNREDTPSLPPSSSDDLTGNGFPQQTFPEPGGPAQKVGSGAKAYQNVVGVGWPGGKGPSNNNDHELPSSDNCNAVP